MKTIILLATLFASFTVAAEGRNLSWDEITSNYSKYQIDGPQVSFGGHRTSIMNVCHIVDGDMLRTKKKVQHYDRTDRGDRTIWTPTHKAYKFTARVYETQVCGGIGDRCRWETEIREYDLSPMITVRAQPRGDRSFGRVLFKKKYNVPTCK